MESLHNTHTAELLDVHKHYMDIINCMPNAVYWVDLDCNLQGFNNNFLKLLRLEELSNYKGTPYDLLHKHANWPQSRVEGLKLDDMAVIFSGKSKYNFEEQPVTISSDKEILYISTRVPLLDKDKKVIGLVVILIDSDDSQKNIEKNTKKLSQELSILDRHNGSAPRVLMVEDNLIAQKVEQNMLETLGCAVDVAETGEGALAFFAAGKYDVIFMDIGLQDTSGYIVAKKIREQEDGTEHHVPIIALTSYKAEVVKHDCREYFMAGAITKPLTMDQAEQIIQHYIYNQDILVEGLVSA